MQSYEADVKVEKTEKKHITNNTSFLFGSNRSYVYGVAKLDNDPIRMLFDSYLTNLPLHASILWIYYSTREGAV